MGILVTKDLIRPVSILVAKVLPDSQNQNAMKNLYAYDSINRILYLKQSLLQLIRHQHQSGLVRNPFWIPMRTRHRLESRQESR